MKNFFVVVPLYLLCYISIVNGQSSSLVGIYVDKFHLILGDVQKEDELLTFCQNRNVNYLMLYDVWRFPIQNSTDPKTLQLVSFIKKAKTSYGILQVGVSGETAAFFQDMVYPYNAIHTNTSEKIDVYNLEFEFWNPNLIGSGKYYCTTYLQSTYSCTVEGAFAFYIKELAKVKTASASAGAITETYVGWPTQGQCQQIIQYADRIFVHAYVQNPITAYNYSRERLSYFGSTTKAITVIPLFSSEPDFMGPWLQNHSLAEVYEIYNQDFAKETSEWKSKIHLNGYQYFTYSQLLAYNSTFLPIQLNNFVVDMYDDKACLYWQTISEINNYGFEIQKSIIDNPPIEKKWEKIGFVEGKGTSSTVTQYQYTDLTVQTGKTYMYRLLQIDKDGSIHYSTKEQDITIVPSRPYLSMNYPNPFNPKTQIDYKITLKEKVSLKVYNIVGENIATLVDKEQEAGNYSVEFNAAALSSGVYFYKLRAGNFISVKKMMFVK